ncbi:glyoxalase superfamily protein [Tropicimonas sediminicola]|uniref:Glyoxalase-related protein domain-containing protein n=1 Tax=Tropicimonas sediminicola TaxID=1031541 RepID=A0A239H663_9RHOB|nr:glyoxalase superfamily protein [Tropicimonas sediminicola]SNS76909.1 hypothetical protein SAMN05421757_103270 [Tropicimonas sediminicola]
MTHTHSNDRLPGVYALKAQARRLRDSLAATGTPVSHSRSLELLAAQLGYRDWNTLHAAANTQPTPNRPLPPLSVGDRVRGSYLGQAFTGEVLALRQIAGGTHHEVTLHFDDPVDVVRFDSFSSFRQRVSATIDGKGVSPQRTSDGAPHLRVAAI